MVSTRVPAHRPAVVPRGGGGRPGGGDGDAASDAARRPRAEPRAARQRSRRRSAATPAPRRRFLPRRRPPGGRGRPAANHVALQRQDRPADRWRAARSRRPRCRPPRRRRARSLPAEDALGLWDFAADMSTDRVTDRSPARLHGRTVNAPKRAVTGHNWDGTEMDWRRAPQQYGAIHFHDDDLYDAGWRPSLTLDHPAGRAQRRVRAAPAGRGRTRLLGGVLRAPAAARAARADGLPRLHRDLSRLLQLSRAACARARPSSIIGALPVVDPTDLLLMHHPELGGSDLRHALRRLRRVPRLAAAADRQHPADRPAVELFLDLCLARLAGAHRSAVRRDHRRGSPPRGLPAPRGLPVVLTGCHPEYYSREMLDALDGLSRPRRPADVHGRQRLLLARRVSIRPIPAMIEVRRAEDGTRAWVGAAGEYYHSLTGEYGGLWRRQGRAPNALAGVGFVGPGLRPLAPTTGARPASRDPRAPSSSRASRTRSSATSAWSAAAPPGSSSTPSTRPGHRRPRPWSWRPRRRHSNAYQLVNEEMTCRSPAPTDGSRRRCAPTWSSTSTRRRRGLLDGLHRLRRQPRAPGLRQQHLPAHPERPTPVPRPHALRGAVTEHRAHRRHAAGRARPELLRCARGRPAAGNRARRGHLSLGRRRAPLSRRVVRPGRQQPRSRQPARAGGHAGPGRGGHLRLSRPVRERGQRRARRSRLQAGRAGARSRVLRLRRLGGHGSRDQAGPSVRAGPRPAGARHSDRARAELSRRHAGRARGDRRPSRRRGLRLR